MMKTLTAIGISAAIVFAPLAAFAQTDAAPAAALPRPPIQRRLTRATMKKPTKKHMARRSTWPRK